VLIKVEAGAAAAAARRPPGSRPARPQRLPLPPVAAPTAASHGGTADLECDMLVLGAGPGGYSAAFRSADLGMKTSSSSATPPSAASA
jgi:dihydrolipoamide dehydrogenase